MQTASGIFWFKCRNLSAVLLYGSMLWVTEIAYGQVGQTDIPSTTKSPQAKAVVGADKSESTDGATLDAENEAGGRSTFVGAPIPTSSPATGSGVTLMGGSIFPLSKNDKVSPPSII